MAEAGSPDDMAEVTGSQMAYDFPCDICHKEHKDVESIVYCFGCPAKLCEFCYGQHNRFPALSGHKIINVTPVLVTLDRIKKIDLTTSGNGEGKEVIGICCATRGETRFTIVSSWYEKKLLVLDGEFQVVSEFKCPDKAYGVVELPKSGLLAVTMRNLTIMVLAKLQPDAVLYQEKTVHVPKSCRGITAFGETFSDGLVIVNGGECSKDPTKGAVNIFSYGAELGTTLNAAIGYKHYKVMPRSVVITKAKDLIFFTDPNIGVLFRDKSGNINKVQSLTGSLVRGARGLCINENDEIFVAGKLSNNVVKFKPNGTVLGEVINVAHGIKKPICLWYDPVRRYLFIGCEKASDTDLVCVRL